MSWTIIRLELASELGVARGSVSPGYLMRLPLAENGMISDSEVAQSPSSAVVRQFRVNGDDCNGRVRRIDGCWGFRCTTAHSRKAYRIENRPIRVGSRLGIITPEGARIQFRVSSIERIADRMAP